MGDSAIHCFRLEEVGTLGLCKVPVDAQSEFSRWS